MTATHFRALLALLLALPLVAVGCPDADNNATTGDTATNTQNDGSSTGNDRATSSGNNDNTGDQGNQGNSGNQAGSGNNAGQDPTDPAARELLDRWFDAFEARDADAVLDLFHPAMFELQPRETVRTGLNFDTAPPMLRDGARVVMQAPDVATVYVLTDLERDAASVPAEWCDALEVWHRSKAQMVLPRLRRLLELYFWEPGTTRAPRTLAPLLDRMRHAERKAFEAVGRGDYYALESSSNVDDPAYLGRAIYLGRDRKRGGDDLDSDLARPPFNEEDADKPDPILERLQASATDFVRIDGRWYVDPLGHGPDPEAGIQRIILERRTDVDLLNLKHLGEQLIQLLSQFGGADALGDAGGSAFWVALFAIESTVLEPQDASLLVSPFDEAADREAATGVIEALLSAGSDPAEACYESGATLCSYFGPVGGDASRLPREDVVLGLSAGRGDTPYRADGVAIVTSRIETEFVPYADFEERFWIEGVTDYASLLANAPYPGTPLRAIDWENRPR